MVTVAEAHFAAIRAAVEASFPVQEFAFLEGRPVFTILPGPDDKERFLHLRRDLDPMGVLPLLRRRDGQTLILLVPKPPPERSRWALPLGLFAATLLTTFLAGYLPAATGCVRGPLSPVQSGLAFSLSLMAILVCHEMGHKTVSIWRGIDASLPLFIPMPPFLGLSIGTMGAVILTRTPAPNRDALLELGASGPIAGFLVAIPILVYGIAHSLIISRSAIIASGCLVSLPAPALVNLMQDWLLHPGPASDVLLHPMAFAGWVGLLVTSINLLPGGMLDGGHVLRAAFGPRLHLIFSVAAAVIAIYLGYWLMGLLILYLVRRGHPGPLDDCSPVTPGRYAMALSLIPIFALSAVRLPIF
jgi:hypothetical protein